MRPRTHAAKGRKCHLQIHPARYGIIHIAVKEGRQARKEGDSRPAAPIIARGRWVVTSRRTIRGRFYLLFLVLNAYIISTNDLKTRVVNLPAESDSGFRFRCASSLSTGQIANRPLTGAIKRGQLEKDRIERFSSFRDIVPIPAITHPHRANDVLNCTVLLPYKKILRIVILSRRTSNFEI